ncbi:hypothetical protein [Amycolatopsis echigonensis]|uniref:hypothetical protein n=1 Tax=Amycolatopsis echigonensis TaxID=2576905 RepID=UPI001ABFBD88|nr:hypothetical protein [Amycolatopsis niigatensis]
MRQVFAAGQRETFGQGVEQPAELQAPQQCLEFRSDLDGFGGRVPGRGGAAG